MRAIITDLDNTLLCPDKTISEYTAGVLRECSRRGILIAAATARPERSVQKYCGQIPFDALITLNGARSLFGGQIYKNGIPHSSGEKILSALLQIPDILISVETEEGIYANADRPEWNAAYYEGFPELPTKGPLYKILVSGVHTLSEEKIGSTLTADTYCTAANHTLFQIMSRKATKWNGIQAVLRAFGISAAEAVYFGDDQDDIEPLRNCGMGVAMSNAHEAALSAAAYRTESNEADGVARFIEQHIL